MLRSSSPKPPHTSPFADNGVPSLPIASTNSYFITTTFTPLANITPSTATMSTSPDHVAVLAQSLATTSLSINLSSNAISPPVSSSVTSTDLSRIVTPIPLDKTSAHETPAATGVATKPEPLSNHVQNLQQIDRETWWLSLKDKAPFFSLPVEIHQQILGYLGPVDIVCLTLVNKYIYAVLPPPKYPLSIGAPDSSHPMPHPTGCRHCLPVLFYPSHCELSFHLRSFFPSYLTYCPSCVLYTRCEESNFSDRHEICGKCGVGYKRRFERGRRMIDMRRPGEEQERIRKWYNL